MAEGVVPGARGNGATGVVPVLFAAALFVYFASMVPTIAELDVIRLTVPWIPSLGIEFAFLVQVRVKGPVCFLSLASSRSSFGHRSRARLSTARGRDDLFRPR